MNYNASILNNPSFVVVDHLVEDLVLPVDCNLLPVALELSGKIIFPDKLYICTLVGGEILRGVKELLLLKQ